MFVVISMGCGMEQNNFGAVYTTFFRKSFLYVKSYVHDETVAEDIVSESLIKLWEILKKEREVKIAPLLFTILKNRALDYLKREKSKMSAIENIGSLSHREMEIRLTTLKISDPEDVFSAEVAQIVQQTLSGLPRKTRLIFEMSRFEGKANKEIAELIGISVKAVEYHISQSLSVLRVSLKDYLPIWFLL
jgi:RNA polymerase sigma-70 factor (ECF subfamily)